MNWTYAGKRNCGKKARQYRTISKLEVNTKAF